VGATFENWESEFLQMAVFILLTTMLVQRGSPESRRPGVKELVDVDPRGFANLSGVPWPVKRGGWILKVYENSLGLAFVFLFLLSWAGHVVGRVRRLSRRDCQSRTAAASLYGLPQVISTLVRVLQNWQSEFLAIASMVWLGVYLRQRYSPESKPVHAPHDETGR
jgi:hypothetical protein